MNRARPLLFLCAPASLAISLLAAGPSVCDEWQLPRVELPSPLRHPAVAGSPEELERLRVAYLSDGPEKAPVAAVVRDAERVLGRALEFPPRGGQHNQWYQCERCQLGLETVDPTHHRCPACATVYSGEPYDDVVFARVHHANLAGASAAAWAWAITGERRFAERAREVLLGYAERYRSYPYHSASRSKESWGTRSGGHLFEQTLTEAASLASHIAPAFDLLQGSVQGSVQGSEALSDADRAAIRQGLFLPMLESIARNRSGKSNWQSWHNAAFLWGGATIGEVDWVRRALADPKDGFGYQMKVSVSEDGMWYENSWGYHVYTLDALVRTAEGARRLGIDIWGSPELRKMVTLPVRYAMPDGSLPRFGDDVQTTVAGAARFLEVLHRVAPDPAWRSFLSGRPTWDSVLHGRKAGQAGPTPSVGSEVFPGAGHAILRARGEGPGKGRGEGQGKGIVAAITFGPYGGFHGHLDKLSFVLFGRGSELGVDPGRARSQAYRLPIHMGWYKATVSHNAVLVDGASQAPASGRLDLFAATGDHAAVAASCIHGYEGVRHTRLLVAMPGYLLVVDDLAAPSRRRFDWIYHNRGETVRCDPLAGAGLAAGELPESLAGRAYIDGVRTGRADGPVRVVFEGIGSADARADGRVPGRVAGRDAGRDAGRIDTHLLAAAAAGTSVATGHGPGASVQDRVPLVILGREGERARFAAAIEPVSGGADPTVAEVALVGGDGGNVAGTIEVRVVRGLRGAESDVIRWKIPSVLEVTEGGRTVLEAR